ncbi:MBG domain-containing protein [Caproiciproducens sp. R1]|uniref:MBG domain-containing protein n=1 Tax=Caproiciproducens sp. R1 TaxID=3435000 RepID=UPI0040348B12
MKLTMRKFLSVLFTACMVVNLLSCTVYAADGTQDAGEIPAPVSAGEGASGSGTGDVRDSGEGTPGSGAADTEQPESPKTGEAPDSGEVPVPDGGEAGMARTAGAPTGSGTITVTQPPEDQSVTFAFGHTVTFTVEASATNGAAVHYEWHWAFSGGDVGDSTNDTPSFTITGLNPGSYEIYCKLTAEGCDSVTSERATLTVDKMDYDGERQGAYSVFSNQATDHISYPLPDLPMGGMEYAVTENYGSGLIASLPSVRCDTNTGDWYLEFSTTSQAVNTSEDITLSIDGKGFYEDSSFTLTVTARDTLEIPISITGADAVYTGNGQKGYDTEPVAPGLQPNELAYRYTGRNGTVYPDSADPPVNAGDYTVTVSVNKTGYTGSDSADFSIAKKPVSVMAPDIYITRGYSLSLLEEMNDFIYYVGFLGTDNGDNCLETRAALHLNVADSSRVGDYPIDYAPEAVLNARGNANYTLAHVPATLFIQSLLTDVLSVNLPSPVIDLVNGTVSGTTPADTSSFTFSATVPSGSGWKLYRDEACTQEIADHTLSLAVGRNPFYLKVTYQIVTDMTRTYSVIITRSASPSPKPDRPKKDTPSSAAPSVPTEPAVNLTGASLPAGVTQAVLAATQLTPAGLPAAQNGTPGAANPDPQAAAVYSAAAAAPGLNMIGTPLLYNLDLLDQSGNPISSFTGSVTVRIPLPAGLPGTPHVFRYENDGTFTDMGAAVADGFLVFSTTHFSYYVIAGVGDSFTLDTTSYRMPANGKYQIGLKLTGTKAASVKVSSTDDKIAAAAKLANGNYLVTGKGEGTAWIQFDVYDPKNNLLSHVSVRVDVGNELQPQGDSTRQTSVF